MCKIPSSLFFVLLLYTIFSQVMKQAYKAGLIKLVKILALAQTEKRH